MVAPTNHDVNTLETKRPHEWVSIPVIAKPSGWEDGNIGTYDDEQLSINTLIGRPIKEGYRIIGNEEIMASTPLMRAIARSQDASWSDDLAQQQIDADLQAEILKVHNPDDDNPSKRLTHQYSEYNHLPEDLHAQYADLTREETWSLESDEFFATPDGLAQRKDECNPSDLKVRGFRKTANWVKDTMFSDSHVTADEWRQCKSLAFMLNIVNDTDDTKANQYWVYTIKEELDNGITNTYAKLQLIAEAMLLDMGDEIDGMTVTSGDILPHGDMGKITVTGGGYKPPPTNDWPDSPNKKHDSDMCYTFKDFAESLNAELQHAIKRVSTKPELVQWREKNNVTKAKGSLFFRTMDKLDNNDTILVGDHPFGSYNPSKIKDLCWRLYHSTIQKDDCSEHVTPETTINAYFRNRNKYIPKNVAEVSS